MNNHSMVIQKDDTLWVSGYNNDYELGDGTKVNNATPKQILTNVARVAGTYHTLALRKDGTAWGWGYNGLGQLGDGTVVSPVTTPKQLPITDLKDVTASSNNSYFLKKDGSLWSCGQNTYGQVGNGIANSTTVATPVQVLSSVRQVSAGSKQVLALKTDGSLWAWGENSSGQVGDGTVTSPVLSPKQILTGIKSVAAGGSHSLALGSDGSLWAWGSNGVSQIGDGTTTGVLSPKIVMTGVKAIAAGYQHSLAIRDDDSLWAWGYNFYGTIGNGSTVNVSAPLKVLDGAAAVTAGEQYSMVLKKDGTLWAWGHNAYGQLGLGHMTSPVTAPTQVSLSNVAALGNNPVIPVILKYLFQDGNEVKKYGKASVVPVMSSTTSGSVAVSASSYAPSTAFPWKAFDGVEGTDNSYSWGANLFQSGPSWLKVDLGQAKTIIAYVISSPYGSNNSPKTFKLEGSNNDVDWTLLDDHPSEATWAAPDTKQFTIANPGSFRLYRLTVSATTYGDYVYVSELQLFDTLNPWMQVGLAPATQAMFDTHGMTNLTPVIDEVLRQLTNPQILTYVDDPGYQPVTILTAVPQPRVIFPKGDIDLVNVDGADSFTVTANQAGTGAVRLLASVDSGATWKTWNNGWVSINHADLAAVKANGMTPATFNARVGVDWNALIPKNTKVRFAYYLETSATTDAANTDALAAQFDMRGVWESAIPGTEWRYSYPNSTTLQIKVLANGDFKFNY